MPSGRAKAPVTGEKPVTPRLCGCLLAASGKALSRWLNHADVDLLEWRLDAFWVEHGGAETRRLLQELARAGRLPVVATNRPVRHGGYFAGEEEERLELLRLAAACGAEWVDLEEDVPAAEVAALRSQGARVMVSHHDFAGTAGRRRLHAKALALAASGPDCIKIATTCRKPGDVLKVLELIPFGQATLKTAVIAFAMGALGRWSRVACLLLGSPWSYVKLPGQPAAAPGQLTPTEVRALWKVLR